MGSRSILASPLSVESNTTGQRGKHRFSASAYVDNRPSTQCHHIRFAVQLLMVVFLSLLSSACTKLGPDFTAPDLTTPEKWSITKSDLFRKPSKDDSTAWWSVFNDKTLTVLIEKAYRQNLTLLAAGLRILEARAQLGVIKGSIYPQVQEMNGDLFTIGTTGPSDNRYYNTASVGFDAAWELDFWGKFRRGIESADANYLASIADYDDLLVSLTAEVARTYVNIRTLQERIKLAAKNGELQKKSLQLVNLQFEAGTVTELDVLQAQTLLTSTLATIPNLRAQLVISKNALAILLGILPHEINQLLPGDGSIPIITTAVAVGLPAEVLRRRPDIRKAEMLAAAQSAQIGIARADLFPSFTLFGSLGWSATDRGGEDLGNIFDSNAFSYSFGPSFTWNLFHYGRLKNNVRVQDARFQQLLVNYQNVVLNAAREVEDAVQNLDLIVQEASLLKEGVESSQKSTDLSILQYREGLADYQRVLDSTRSLTQKQDQYAQTRGRIAVNIISLYKAVGGGWQIREEGDFVPQEVQREMAARTDWGSMSDQ